MEEEITCDNTCKHFYITKSFKARCNEGRDNRNNSKEIPKSNGVPLWCPRRKKSD